MGIGHRHDQRATEYERIQALFANAPPNVVPIWPENSLSSYNLADIANVALIGWSSIGLELARFGLPVVAAFRDIGVFPAEGFIDWAPTEREYLAKIEGSIGSGAKLDQVTEAFRWTNYLHWSPLVDVSDVIPSPDYFHVPRPRRLRNHAIVAKALIDGIAVSTTNLSRLPDGPSALEVEREAIVHAMERIILHFIGAGTSQSTRLVVDTNPIVPAGDTAVLHLEDNGYVTLVVNGNRVRKRSGIAWRLGHMLATHSDKRAAFKQPALYNA